MEKEADIDRIAETVVQGWVVFVEAGLLSPTYRLAKRHYPHREAAELALLDCYMRFCAVPDRARLFSDPVYFRAYARLFSEELSRFAGLNAADQLRLGKRLCRHVRLLCAETRAHEERDRHTLLKAVFGLCSREERILEAYARRGRFQKAVGKRPPHVDALIRMFPVLALEEKLSALRRPEAG